MVLSRVCHYCGDPMRPALADFQDGNGKGALKKPRPNQSDFPIDAPPALGGGSRGEDFSGRLLKAQEQERRRIARDLHDDVSQQLGLLVLELEQTKQLLLHSGVKIQNRLDRVHRRALDISSALQSLAHELHPPKLEYLGLAAAARSLCREFAQQRKVSLDFDEADLPSTLSEEISTCLFRVLQEGLHNIAKHSGARFAEVKLQGSPSEIHLLIRDSGMGFDPEGTSGDGLGLISMRERVRLMKGTISVRSKPKFGTEISVRVPLQGEAIKLNRRETEVRI